MKGYRKHKKQAKYVIRQNEMKKQIKEHMQCMVSDGELVIPIQYAEDVKRYMSNSVKVVTNSCAENIESNDRLIEAIRQSNKKRKKRLYFDIAVYALYVIVLLSMIIFGIK